MDKIKSYSNYTSIGIIERKGDYFYFPASMNLKPFPIMYRMKEKNDYRVKQDLSNAQVFMDPTKLKDNESKKVAIDLDESRWSDDGKYYAYQAKKSGSDWATIMIREAASMIDMPKDRLSWVKFS